MLKKPQVQFPHKMLSRLLASHILLVTIPLLATAYFLINTAETTVKSDILKRNQEIAVRSARQIELTLESVIEKLKLVAAYPAITGSNAGDQQFILHTLVNNYPIFREIDLLSTGGEILHSTAFAGEQNGDVQPEVARILPGLLNGQHHTSEVYLSDEQLPMMDIYVPVAESDFDEVVAILLAKIDLKEIWELVDNSKIGGDQAEAFLFRENGQFVAHTSRRFILEPHYFDAEKIREDIRNKISSSRIYVNSDGVELAAAYAPIRGIGWGIVIQEPADEAFAVVDEMQQQIQLLLWVSVALASLIAFFYSRNILRPVERLVRGINRIASGDLHYRIEPLGKDEISQLARHINEMSAKLRTIQNKLKRTERLETLGKLASVLSHEIRNPLNSMVINMQILSREFRKKAIDLKKLDHYSNVVVSEIKRVDDLVSNFLLIAKPPKLELERIELDTVLDELISMQQPFALPRGIRIERRYKSGRFSVEADVGKIKQVFLNIILNAFQAMPGGGRLLIEMEGASRQESSEEPAMVRVRIKDTGKGIKLDELQHIFDFYYSTKPKGTGLGLSVAQQIVEEHGGHIVANSEYGNGTEFVVLLPLMASGQAVGTSG